MTSISDIGQNSYMQALLSSTRDNLNKTQAQISSGRKADTYAGMGGVAAYQSLSLRAQDDQITSYLNNLNSVGIQTSAMDSQMSNMTTLANKMVGLMEIPTQSGDPGMINLAGTAKNMLQQIQQALNTTANGRYVFAGTDTNHPPVANAATINTSVNTDLSAFAAGTETAAQVLGNVQAYTQTQQGYSPTIATAGNITVRAQDNIDIDYTVKGTAAPFQQLMQGLSIIANLQYTPSNQAGFYQIYNGAMAMIQNASAGVTQQQATLGIATKQMSDAQTSLAAQQTTVKTFLGNAEDVDVAAASTQLQNFQTQLETSYQIIATLKGLSLLNYLH